MSKPIKVVVVVVVMVVVCFFFEKELGPKSFDPKNNSCQKNLRPKSVGSQKKIWVQKKLGPKKFWSKNNKIKKNRSNKTLGPDKFGVQKILSPTNFGYKSVGKLI